MPRPKYSITLDVSELLIVIVGGGKVAARKATGLIEAGATHVRVIAPELRGDFSSCDTASIEHIAQKYQPASLDSAQLVFAATDEPRVNAAVVRDAHERGLLVCRADATDDEPGDFTTPAGFVEGTIHVTVSSGSAALSAMIRNELKSQWQSAWTQMSDFMQSYRARLVAYDGLSGEQRRKIFLTLASQEAFSKLADGGSEELLQWLSIRHPETKNV